MNFFLSKIQSIKKTKEYYTYNNIKKNLKANDKQKDTLVKKYISQSMSQLTSNENEISPYFELIDKKLCI